MVKRRKGTGATLAQTATSSHRGDHGDSTAVSECVSEGGIVEVDSAKGQGRANKKVGPGGKRSQLQKDGQPQQPGIQGEDGLRKKIKRKRIPEQKDKSIIDEKHSRARDEDEADDNIGDEPVTNQEDYGTHQDEQEEQQVDDKGILGEKRKRKRIRTRKNKNSSKGVGGEQGDGDLAEDADGVGAAGPTNAGTGDRQGSFVAGMDDTVYVSSHGADMLQQGAIHQGYPVVTLALQ